ncbi:pentapeptide repeat-containing protein [Tychonema sp. LEGE 06208]|uniref:pentapeptide repeat-containing protein n=1 Tax=Tychonema sp. LEGE 06208 TaxID=1828663 RepID=UPI001881E165|nr:pentapeptide repeat-containing protein [Tychonema sp. LEGE 06208]MBE9161061.1 pentapeptide repeat-containing protein [Tychonema sp. LEGE 06208]
MQVQEFLLRYQEGERNFAHIDLSGASLSGVNLREINLTGANLTGANLSWSCLSNAKLIGACLRRADLRNAVMSGANLSGANLSGANVAKADLRFACLEAAELNWTVLSEADLGGANLQKVKSDQINLEKAKLDGAQLMGAKLMEANLNCASLVGANLTDANLREAHLVEANLRSAILSGVNLIEADLNGAQMRSANLAGADLHRAVLAGADLTEAVLDNADLSRANLAGAYLLKASFKKALLLRANLQGVYLLRADLSEANLRGADLRKADLSGAYLMDAMLGEADLREACLIECRLIRTSLEGAQLTGCCIQNWQVQDVDLSKVDCGYVFTQFDYAAKVAANRFPAARDFESGELGRQNQEESSIVEVYFADFPNWEALVFTVRRVELESWQLQLNVQFFESAGEQNLLRLSANRLVNGKILGDRILALYPDMLEKVLAKRAEIWGLLDLAVASNSVEPQEPSHNEVLVRKQEIYQRMVRQISFILMSQTPDKFSESVQRLLDYLKQQGIPTIQIQRKVISQAIVQRAKQDPGFREQLILWEKTAPANVRGSMMGEAVRGAIGLLSE